MRVTIDDPQDAIWSDGSPATVGKITGTLANFLLPDLSQHPVETHAVQNPPDSPLLEIPPGLIVQAGVFKSDATITKELRLEYQQRLQSGIVKDTNPLSFVFNAVPVLDNIQLNAKCQVVVWAVWVPLTPPTLPGSPPPPPPTQQVEFGVVSTVRKPPRMS
jgi:hypothetical protein